MFKVVDKKSSIEVYLVKDGIVKDGSEELVYAVSGRGEIYNVIGYLANRHIIWPLHLWLMKEGLFNPESVKEYQNTILFNSAELKNKFKTEVYDAEIIEEYETWLMYCRKD